MSPRVWVTRTLPEADATAARLRNLGFEAVVAPVLEARVLAEARFDLAGVDALAFTSSHAVRAFAALSAARDLPAFAVGDRTAEAARAAGFGKVRSAAGDAAALAETIAAMGVRRVLHPRAAVPAADLDALLAARGVTARGLAVYETAPSDLGAAPPDVAVVLVHSPKGAARVAGLVDSLRAGALTALCISRAAAAPLERHGFAEVRSAPFPNEASLLDLLKEPPNR
jgi:uroporphyrinogen-III synthase